MKYLIGMILCFFGAVFLTGSDVLINMAASSVVGSSAESAQSARLVAIGISIALVAVGSVLVAIKDQIAKYAVGFVVVLASAFSAGLTVQGTSIDYAANDHSGAIQGERRSGNRHKIKRYEAEIKQLNRKMKECAKDNYFVPCASTERRIAALSDKIASISDDNLASKMAQKIDIGDAVEAKSGLPALYVERSIIFARAFAVPLLITILSFGFWTFWSLFFKDEKVTKSVSRSKSTPAPAQKKSRLKAV